MSANKPHAIQDTTHSAVRQSRSCCTGAELVSSPFLARNKAGYATNKQLTLTWNACCADFPANTSSSSAQV